MQYWFVNCSYANVKGIANLQPIVFIVLYIS